MKTLKSFNQEYIEKAKKLIHEILEGLHPSVSTPGTI